MLSEEAVQLKLICEALMVVAVRLLGAVGGCVSGGFPYHCGIWIVSEAELTWTPTRPFTEVTTPPGLDSLMAIPAPNVLTPELSVIPGVNPTVDCLNSAYCSPPPPSGENSTLVKPDPGVTVTVV